MSELITAGSGQTMGTNNEGAAVLDAILQAAQNPATDVDKIRSLFELHERMTDRRAETDFHNAMTNAQERMRPISADAMNPQTRSKYAKYDQLDRALRPIYTACGFGLSFDTDDSPKEDHVRVLCIVSHRGGHKRTYKIDMPVDGKGARGNDVMTKTHAVGSGTSYGMRYLLKMIFNVAIGEADDDGNGGGYSPEPEPEYLDWHEAIRGAFSVDDLRAVKKEMAEKFGADKVPAVLVRAYNARLNEVRS